MMNSPDLGRPDLAHWVEDGQKYVLIALIVKLDGYVPLGEITRNHWAFTSEGFEVPSPWRHWLGSIRTENIEKCNLFLLSKRHSVAPDVVDAETTMLEQHVWHFYSGLLLASSFSPAERPILLAGSRHKGQINVRSYSDWDRVIPGMVSRYPSVKLSDLELAAKLASQIAAIETAELPGGHWRLFRIMHLYLKTRTICDNMDRLHQYCRCIEGLIVSDAGRGKQQFKSRTELFIGPQHHSLMGDAYDLRSDVEHLHENKHLEIFNRTTRIELVKKLEMMEYIARNALARILLDRKLWQHFANTNALKAFWSKDEHERRALWGSTIDPLDALADFCPTYVTDTQLGGGL